MNMFHNLLSVILFLTLWINTPTHGYPKGKNNKNHKIKGAKVKPDDTRKKISNQQRGGGAGRGPQVTNIQDFPLSPINIPFPLMPYQVPYPVPVKQRKGKRRPKPDQKTGSKGFKKVNPKEINEYHDEKQRSVKKKRRRLGMWDSSTGYVKLGKPLANQVRYALLLYPIASVPLAPSNKQAPVEAKKPGENSEDEGEKYIKEGYEEGKDVVDKDDKDDTAGNEEDQSEQNEDGGSGETNSNETEDSEEREKEEEIVEDEENEKDEGNKKAEIVEGAGDKYSSKSRGSSSTTFINATLHDDESTEFPQGRSTVKEEKSSKTGKAGIRKGTDHRSKVIKSKKNKEALQGRSKFTFIKQKSKQSNSDKRSDLQQQDFLFEDNSDDVPDDVEYDEPLDMRIRDVSDEGMDTNAAERKLEDTEKAAQVMTMIQQKLGADPNNIIEDTHSMMNYLRKQMQQYDEEIDKDILEAQRAQMQAQDGNMEAAQRSGIENAKTKLEADRSKENELRTELQELKNVELMTTAIELAKYLALEKSKQKFRSANTIANPKPSSSFAPAPSFAPPPAIPAPLPAPVQAVPYQPAPQPAPAVYNPPYPTMFAAQPYPYAASFVAPPPSVVSHPPSIITRPYPVAAIGPSAFTYGQVEFNPRPENQGSAEAMSRHQTLKPHPPPAKPHHSKPARPQSQGPYEPDWGTEGGSSLSFPGPTYSLPPFSAKVASQMQEDQDKAPSLSLPAYSYQQKPQTIQDMAPSSSFYPGPVLPNEPQVANIRQAPSLLPESYLMKPAPAPAVSGFFQPRVLQAPPVAPYQPSYPNYRPRLEAPSILPAVTTPAASKGIVQPQKQPKPAPVTPALARAIPLPYAPAPAPPPAQAFGQPVMLAGPSAYYANMQRVPEPQIIPYQQPIITSYAPGHPTSPVEVLRTDAHDFTGQKKPSKPQGTAAEPQDTSANTIPYWFGLFPKLPDDIQDKTKQSGEQDQEMQKQYEDASLRLQNTEKAAEALTHIENKIGFDPGSIAKLVDFVKSAAVKDVDLSEKAVSRDQISVAQMNQEHAKKSFLPGTEDVALDSAQQKLKTDQEILSEAQERLEKIKRMESVVTEIEAAKYDAIKRAEANYSKKRSEVAMATTSQVTDKKPSKRSTRDSFSKKAKRSIAKRRFYRRHRRFAEPTL